MAMEERAFDQARQLYASSLAIYRRTGIKSGLTSTLANLGTACLEAGVFDAARSHLREALETAREGEARPVLLKVLLGWARWLRHMGRAEPSLALLTLVAHHPATEEANRVAARQLLEGQSPGVVPVDLEAALTEATARVLREAAEAHPGGVSG
jgi:hypothetical protein